jgi:hypothetical protein
MIDRHHFHYNLTPEDRRIRAKWARGIAVVYGTALLLLVVAIATQQMLAEPTTETTVATAPVKAASPIGRN